MTTPRSEATRGPGFPAVVVVMAKEPEPGRVKTRLCPPLSMDMAARCYDAFVADTLARIGAAAGGWAELELAIAPGSGAATRLRALAAADGWRCVEQRGETLGDRMGERLKAAVASGKSVVLFGSDSPDMPVDRVSQAFLALDRASVVLGPATDGGYYLIGCRGRVPDVFGDDIPWGTSGVLKETLARLDASVTAAVLLEPWPDVDDWPGLLALARRLRSARAAGESCAPQATMSSLAELVQSGLSL